MTTTILAFNTVIIFSFHRWLNFWHPYFPTSTTSSCPSLQRGQWTSQPSQTFYIETFGWSSWPSSLPWPGFSTWLSVSMRWLIRAIKTSLRRNPLNTLQALELVFITEGRICPFCSNDTFKPKAAHHSIEMKERKILTPFVICYNSWILITQEESVSGGTYTL